MAFQRRHVSIEESIKCNVTVTRETLIRYRRMHHILGACRANQFQPFGGLTCTTIEPDQNMAKAYFSSLAPDERGRPLVFHNAAAVALAFALPGPSTHRLHRTFQLLATQSLVRPLFRARHPRSNVKKSLQVQQSNSEPLAISRYSHYLRNMTAITCFHNQSGISSLFFSLSASPFYIVQVGPLSCPCCQRNSRYAYCQSHCYKEKFFTSIGNARSLPATLQNLSPVTVTTFSSTVNLDATRYCVHTGSNLDRRCAFRPA